MSSRKGRLFAIVALLVGFEIAFVTLINVVAWLSQNPQLKDWPYVREFPGILVPVSLLCAGMAVCFWLLGEFWISFVQRFVHRLLVSSRILRALDGVARGVTWGLLSAIVIALVIGAARVLLKRIGLNVFAGPQTWILPLAATIGLGLAVYLSRIGWRGTDLLDLPARANAAMQSDRLGTPPGPIDIPNIELDEETFASGRDASGWPYFVWRESADNRLGYSRPRYCRVVEVDDNLLFQFFNPSKNVRSTGASMAMLVAGGGIFVWAFGAAFVGPVGDSFATVVAGFLYACFAAIGLGGVWYAATTMARWAKNRFEGDGHLYELPWRDLVGFQVVAAEATGANRSNRKAPGGEGLFADFGGRAPSLPLTANFWNHDSIAEKHRMMTRAFVEERAPVLAEWEARRKHREQQQAAVNSLLPATSNQGVPDTL